MYCLHADSFRALENRFISDLLSIRQTDPLSSLLVIIPTGRLRTHLQRQLLKSQPGVLQIRFLTLFGLAEQVLAEGPAREDRVVTEPALQEEMIRQLLEGSAEETFQLRDDFLGTQQTISRGLPGALAGTLKDLRDSGMRVTDAMKAAIEGHLGAEAASAAPTLELYARVYSILQKHGLRTPSDFLRRAAEQAPHSAFLKRQKTVFVYGFYDWTGVQLDLVLSLAGHPDARVYVPYEEGNPAYAFAEKFLKDPAFQSKLQCPHPDPLPPTVGEGVNDDAVGAVVNDLHPRPRNAGEGRGEGTAVHQSLISCSGARDEIWFAAKEILALLDKGVLPQDIALVARTLDPYLAALKEIFSTHHIPYQTSKGEPAGSHPWIKRLRARLKESLKEGEERGEKTWVEHIEWAKTLIQDPSFGEFGMERRLGIEYSRTPNPISTRHPNSPMLGCHQLLLQSVLSSLQDLEILDVLNKPVSRRHFVETWQARLDALELPLSDTPIAGVQVLEVQQARGLRFNSVFLLGLNEKVFPRLIREDPFLSDAARSRLAEALGARLSRKLDGYAEERLLFELMTQTAEEQLYFLWQRSDEEGKILIPSIYVQERLRAQKSKAGRVPRTWPDKLKNHAVAGLTPKELSYLLNRAGLTPDPLYAALGWNVERFQHLLRAQRAMESFRPGILALDGKIESSERLQQVLQQGFSPSGLEKLAQCPYQYFAGHILRIPVPEDLAPEGVLTPSALGKLFHRTLELFFTRYPVPTKAPPEKVPGTYLSAACNQAFEEFKQRYPQVYPLVLKASKNNVFQYLSRFIESDLEECRQAGFEPSHAEFVLQGTIAELGDSLAHIPFHGRADRVDIKKASGDTFARVVDYKSGKADKNPGKLETALIKGRYLQLPLYMGLVRSYLENQGGGTVHSVALRWLRPDDQEKPAPFITPEFWRSSSASLFIENIKGLINLVEKGHFYIEPDTGEWGHCSRCDFARVCRKEHMPTRARAEGDPMRLANEARLSRTASQ